MLKIENLLCLYSARTRQTYIDQALYLGGLLDANVHIASATELPSATKNRIREFAEAQAVPQSSSGHYQPVAEGVYTSVEDVNEYVREYDIDLVVSGTPGDRGAVPVMAAHETAKLVTEVESSLLILNPDSDVRSWTHIVVPTDFSDDAHVALQGALKLADILDAEVDLLHVIETIPYVALTRMDRLSMSDISFPEHRARRQLKRFLGSAPETEVPINTHLQYGDPADQITHFLNRDGSDLMVCSLRFPNHSGEMLGPVSDRLLRRVTCPLLLVRS